MNTTTVWIALNTTETLWDDSTKKETQEEVDLDLGEWPYFKIFGKPYLSFVLIIAAVGVIGNILVVILMSDVKLNSISYSVYMRWLAVSDSCVLITAATEDATYEYHYFDTIFTYHIAICKIWTFISMSVMFLSPWLVIALTFDRFICVVFPLKRNLLCSKSKAIKVCICLTVLSMIMNIGELTQNDEIEGTCEYKDDQHYFNYQLFTMLCLTSTFPCTVMLILNIVIIIKIRQSASFRKRFQNSGTKTTMEKTDKATLPLLLVSVFAFVTLTPIAVTESVDYLPGLPKADPRAFRLANAIWPLTLLIYLLNFGQNFYIMMASSVQYRKIMSTKFGCFEKRRRTPVNEIQCSGPSYMDRRSSIPSSTGITESSLASSQSTDLGF